MQYRSEIRDSQIRALREKVEAQQYRKYLVSMTLHQLRAFRDVTIRFRFPVTALIGPNGGGKSTVLGAAALIYGDSKPADLFAVSSADKDAMRGAKIVYRVIDRGVKRDGELERSVTYPQDKWSRKALARTLKYEGFRRIVPAGERPGFSKYRSGANPLTEEGYAGLGADVIRHASAILRFDLNGYAESAKKPLLGRSGATRFSEFHIGAGISVIIHLVRELEALSPDDQALVLIEEIENTLHPYAVRKLVEYLIGVAERKKCQIIFTTHSEYALDPLPREAIWAARDGALVNGRLHVEDVLAFRGDVETKLAVFCEDATAMDWLQGMMRYSGMTDELALVEFHAVGGTSDVVRKVREHNSNPAVRFRALGFVDGDAPPELALGADVHRLPGSHSPEEVLLDCVRAGFDRNLAVLTVGLMRPPQDQELVRKIVESEALAAVDMHLVFNKIGQRLGFVPEGTVRLAMINAYCHSRAEDANALAALVRERLPRNGTPRPTVEGRRDGG